MPALTICGVTVEEVFLVIYHPQPGAPPVTSTQGVFMNDDAEHPKKSSDALSGWRFWLVMILAGLTGKFFVLLGGAIFLGLWWLVEWLWKKKA